MAAVPARAALLLLALIVAACASPRAAEAAGANRARAPPSTSSSGLPRVVDGAKSNGVLDKSKCADAGSCKRWIIKLKDEAGAQSVGSVCLEATGAIVDKSGARVRRLAGTCLRQNRRFGIITFRARWPADVQKLRKAFADKIEVRPPARPQRPPAAESNPHRRRLTAAPAARRHSTSSATCRCTRSMSRRRGASTASTSATCRWTSGTSSPRTSPARTCTCT